MLRIYTGRRASVKTQSDRVMDIETDTAQGLDVVWK